MKFKFIPSIKREAIKDLAKYLLTKKSEHINLNKASRTSMGVIIVLK